MVDNVLDTEEIVVKALGRLFSQLSTFAGATIMGDGHVALILDVAGLAQRAKILTSALDASLESIATKVEILSPEERDCPCEPAVFLTNQPAKITGAMILGQTVSDALASATATTVTHLPTLAYQIDDAVLIDGAIYSEGVKYWIAQKKDSAKQVLDLHSAAVSSTIETASAPEKLSVLPLASVR